MEKVQNLISVQSCLIGSLEYHHCPLFGIFNLFHSKLRKLPSMQMTSNFYTNLDRNSDGILVRKAAVFTYCIIQLVVKMLQCLPLEHHQLLLHQAILTENPKIEAGPQFHLSYSEIWLLKKEKKAS